MSNSKCSAVKSRENLIVSNALAKAGVDFVPVIVTSKQHKAELIKALQEAIELLVGES